MKETIFNYKSYKSYLLDLMKSQPGKGRGMRSSLAAAARCQSTYVSQVLNGDRHFSLEQAELINLHLDHTQDEARYFLHLVSYERASTSSLKARIKREMDLEISKQSDLKTRLNAHREELSPEVQSEYYRVWYHAAIHICLTIAGLRTKESIAAALGIPMAQVSESLNFLTQNGIAKKVGQEYHTGQNLAFVSKDSPHITQHHFNWRHQAIRSIELNRKEDVHYSVVISVNKKEVQKIKSMVLQLIEDSKAVWQSSQDEVELHSICVDFFEVSRGR